MWNTHNLLLEHVPDIHTCNKVITFCSCNGFDLGVTKYLYIAILYQAITK